MAELAGQGTVPKDPTPTLVRGEALTTPMRELLWRVAQHKYGWIHVSRHGGWLQVADGLVARGLVTYGTLHDRSSVDPRILITEDGIAEVQKLWPVSPLALGTYEPQPGGWTPLDAVPSAPLVEEGGEGT